MSQFQNCCFPCRKEQVIEEKDLSGGDNNSLKISSGGKSKYFK